MRPAIALILLAGLLAQCHEPEVDNRNYFPLDENATWNYIYQYFATDDDSTFLWADTVKLTVQGDTIIDNITYKRVANEGGLITKAVRVVDGKYYSRDYYIYSGFTGEYLFLDQNAARNTTWTNTEDGFDRVEYKVIATHASRTYNSVTYSDVLELEVTHYYNNVDDQHLTTRHFYARGVGEIYAYYPYPASFTYSNLNVSLLGYTPH